MEWTPGYRILHLDRGRELGRLRCQCAIRQGGYYEPWSWICLSMSTLDYSERTYGLSLPFPRSLAIFTRPAKGARVWAIFIRMVRAYFGTVKNTSERTLRSRPPIFSAGLAIFSRLISSTHVWVFCLGWPHARSEQSRVLEGEIISSTAARL